MEFTSYRLSKRLVTMAVATLAGSFLSSVPAVADKAQNADTQGSLGEIVVTAQYKEQKLQDTPIAITAISAASIEQHSAVSLADVAATAPSVTLRPASAAFGNSIGASIRGFGQSDFNPAYEPGVGLYIDDVYYPRLTGANFDLLDVDRVEVLRGPQGTLTGRNSEGGAIRFVTRKPTGDGGGYVSATYGSRDRVNLRASADFKIADGWSARLSGAYNDQRGYVDVLDYGCTHPDSGVASAGGGIKCSLYSLGDTGYRAMRGILRYNPSSALDVSLSADYVRDVHHNGAEVLLYGHNINPNVVAPTNSGPGLPLDSNFICGQWCNYSVVSQTAAPFQAGIIPPLQGLPMAATAGSPLSTYQGWGTSLNIDLSITDKVKLTSITGYRKWDSEFTVDTDLAPTQVGIGINALNHWFKSEELRLNAEFTNRITGTVGAYFSDEQTTYYSLQDIRYVAVNLPTVSLPIFPLQFIQNDPVRTKSRAVYGTVIDKITDELTLTAGLRFTKDSKQYTFYRYNLDGHTINPFLDGVGAAYGIGYVGTDANGNPIAALSGSSPNFEGNHTDYRVSLDYRFNPSVLGYATVSTGYKAGGIGPRPFNAAQARPFGSETLTNYELGLKTDLLDRRLRINVSAFYVDFKDAQLTLLSCPQFGGPGPCALPQNAGNAKVKGAEIELTAAPVDGLQIDLSGSYLNWDWTCVNPAVVGGASGPCSSDPTVVSKLNQTPPGVVTSKWSGGVQYEVQLSNGSTLTPRLDAIYQGALGGSVVAAAPGSPSAQFGTVDAYTVANARLTWVNPSHDLDVALEVTNLTDKYYFLSKFDLTGAGSGTISGSPGRPREWAVTVKKKF
jgi:iron complex outermembrane receptor protein